MRNPRLTQRYKSLLLTLGAVALLLLAWRGNGVVLWMEQTDARSAWVVARNAKFNLEQKFEDGQQVIELLRVVRQFFSLESPSGCMQTLSVLEARFPQYQNFAFLDADGVAICSDISQSLQRPAQVLLYPNLLVDAKGVLGGMRRQAVHPPSNDVLEEIAGKSGQVIVVASSHWFTRAIDTSSLPAGTVWFITDDSGQAVRRSRADRRHELPSSVEMRALLSAEKYGMELTTGDGIARYYVGVPLSFGRETYHLFVGVPADMLRAGPAQLGRQIQFALVFIAVIFILMLLLVIHH